ncbi:MAG: hypothetical protein AAFQ92_30280, partial [Bacteroidota bacterium]
TVHRRYFTVTYYTVYGTTSGVDGDLRAAKNEIRPKLRFDKHTAHCTLHTAHHKTRMSTTPLCQPHTAHNTRHNIQQFEVMQEVR